MLLSNGIHWEKVFSIPRSLARWINAPTSGLELTYDNIARNHGGLFRGKWSLSVRSYRSTPIPKESASGGNAPMERTMCAVTMNDNVFALLEDISAPTRLESSVTRDDEKRKSLPVESHPTHYRTTYITVHPPQSLDMLLAQIRAPWKSARQASGQSTGLNPTQVPIQLSIEGSVFSIGTDWLVRAGNVFLAGGTVRGMLIEAEYLPLHVMPVQSLDGTSELLSNLLTSLLPRVPDAKTVAVTIPPGQWDEVLYTGSTIVSDLEPKTDDPVDDIVDDIYVYGHPSNHYRIGDWHGRFIRPLNQYQALYSTSQLRTSQKSLSGPLHFYQNKQLELYASRKVHPLTLRQLVFFGKSMNEERLIKSANYVRTELPVRIAHRIRDMQALPYVVVTREGVAKVYEIDQACTIISRFRRYPHINTLKENDDFCHFLRNLLDEQSVNRFVPSRHPESIFRALVGFSSSSTRPTRFIHETGHDRANPIDNHRLENIGIIYTDICLKSSIERCLSLLKLFPHTVIDSDPTFLEYGANSVEKWPELIIDGEPNTRFSYIKEHLEYIIFELLKNALRFTILHNKHSGKPMPIVRATIVAGPDDVSVRISDQGGGLYTNPHIRLPSDLFSFSHVRNAGRLDDVRLDALRGAILSPKGIKGTVHEQVELGPDRDGDANLDLQERIKFAQVPSRVGIGLPMSNVYAGYRNVILFSTNPSLMLTYSSYFGGSLQLVPMDGWGTDVYVRLPRLHLRMPDENETRAEKIGAKTKERKRGKEKAKGMVDEESKTVNDKRRENEVTEGIVDQSKNTNDILGDVTEMRLPQSKERGVVKTLREERLQEGLTVAHSDTPFQTLLAPLSAPASEYRLNNEEMSEHESEKGSRWCGDLGKETSVSIHTTSKNIDTNMPVIQSINVSDLPDFVPNRLDAEDARIPILSDNAHFPPIIDLTGSPESKLGPPIYPFTSLQNRHRPIPHIAVSQGALIEQNTLRNKISADRIGNPSRKVFTPPPGSQERPIELISPLKSAVEVTTSSLTSRPQFNKTASQGLERKPVKIHPFFRRTANNATVDEDVNDRSLLFVGNTDAITYESTKVRTEKGKRNKDKSGEEERRNNDKGAEKTDVILSPCPRERAFFGDLTSKSADSTSTLRSNSIGVEGVACPPQYSILLKARALQARWPNSQNQHVMESHRLEKGRSPFPRRIKRTSKNKEIETTRMSLAKQLGLSDELVLDTTFRIASSNSSSTTQPEDAVQSMPHEHREHPMIARILSCIEQKNGKGRRRSAEDPDAEIPFDCRMWTTKWKPRHAAEALGNESQTLYLREWLKALAIRDQERSAAVTKENTEEDEGKVGTQRKRNRSKKRKEQGVKRRVVIRSISKRKRRRIGSEEDEDEDMSWIVDDNGKEDEDEKGANKDEGDWIPNEGKSQGSDYNNRYEEEFSKRLTNTILLVGAPGTGKTSAVYICAEELGWEVFEVYPGIGRRAGLNIVGLIGDVGKNHIVGKVSDDGIGTNVIAIMAWIFV
ncbi:hypothetical protein Clacol_001676 [Clathrus columnatus]|uniref:Protein-serine/threonine kinase n=1 Tax=Clathrus columnatus TaxID=1419009 RepID=A0AAV5A2H5_9AGAM|nr:hypothetical protein Clacol_001676 [Clathrus columnatus]